MSEDSGNFKITPEIRRIADGLRKSAKEVQEPEHKELTPEIEALAEEIRRSSPKGGKP